MDEATLCDRIALIQNGKILGIDTPQNVVNSYEGNLYKIRARKMYNLLRDLNIYAHTLSCYAFGEFLHVSLKQDDNRTKADLLHYLDTIGHLDIEMLPVVPTIEDCFIKLLKN
jgi:ABC-type multidrug transport system ATPase subunit